MILGDVCTRGCTFCNVATGRHRLDVRVDGKLPNGEEWTREQEFAFAKDVAPRLLELTVGGPAAGPSPIALEER